MNRPAHPPLRIGRRLALVAPGSPPVGDGRVAVRVPRGAFGSGEHETTAACLEAMESLDALVGARVLDLGSGTGVLGVAAVLLGARAATCVDVDPAAVAVSLETAAANRVAERVTCVHGDLAAAGPGPFEIVLANLYADVLDAVAPALLSVCVPGAPLVLSGIAWEQEYAVRSRYLALGCSATASRWGEEWVTLTLAAPPHGRGRPGGPSELPAPETAPRPTGGSPS